jgi:hypothetical protein
VTNIAGGIHGRWKIRGDPRSVVDIRGMSQKNVAIYAVVAAAGDVENQLGVSQPMSTGINSVQADIGWLIQRWTEGRQIISRKQELILLAVITFVAKQIHLIYIPIGDASSKLERNKYIQ